MGSTYSVKYLSGDDSESKNKKIIEDILTDINQQMSHYIVDRKFLYLIHSMTLMV
ncbi:MAG: hypothetical protein Ct9H90mP15_01950 [Candidatus Neomarinimicrobiota bacterium]|nr:MAG: hypothetical protein Ct9H90mP15_01950 [Candidatus Neomarinimicrobiota bacterium]